MKKYGVMLIGCGHIGAEHLSDIYYRDEFFIQAVVDSAPARVEEFKRRYGAVKGGTDYREFLNDDAVDIVIIATYTDTHVSILEQCIAAGKHVLCEKPIGCTLEEGKRFFELAQTAKTKVLVAHILRHNQSYQMIADLIHQGAIGKLRLMRMVQNHHALNWPRYKRLMEDCPPMVDCGVHYLDVMQWFTQSKIVQVCGISTRLDEDAPCDNYGMIAVRLANGCIGYYEAGWGRNLASGNIKEFVGDAGRITLTLQANRSSDQEEGDLIMVYNNENNVYKTINVQSRYKNMYGQMKTLVDMIENNSAANPTMEDVYEAFCAVQTAWSAISQGKFLPIKDEA